MTNEVLSELKDVAEASRLGMATHTRSRKVQAELKGRGEEFLAKANAPRSSSSGIAKATSSKKRKLQDTLQSEQSRRPIRRKVLTPLESDKKPTPRQRSDKESRAASGRKRIMSATGAEGTLRSPKSTQRSPKPASSAESSEKRARRFRKQAPQNYLQKLFRAETQRMIVLQRTRVDTEPFPKEEVELVGSTGNVYTVTIGQIPSCTCPDHRKGNECKHKVYVLRQVLKAPEHLQYQLAFLSSELKDIFAASPAIPTDLVSAENTDGKRKPIEGECPICYMDLDEEHNALVWCRAACGNNMHRSCFDQWAAASRDDAGVRCVYCRTPWQADLGRADPDAVKKSGSVGVDGYVNVAQQFGLSQVRDYSTYHPQWTRRHLGTGW